MSVGKPPSLPSVFGVVLFLDNSFTSENEGGCVRPLSWNYYHQPKPSTGAYYTRALVKGKLRILAAAKQTRSPRISCILLPLLPVDTPSALPRVKQKAKCMASPAAKRGLQCQLTSCGTRGPRHSFSQACNVSQTQRSLMCQRRTGLAEEIGV